MQPVWAPFKTPIMKAVASLWPCGWWVLDIVVAKELKDGPTEDRHLPSAVGFSCRSCRAKIIDECGRKSQRQWMMTSGK